MTNRSAATAAPKPGVLEPVTSNKIAQVKADKAPVTVKDLTSDERKQLSKCEEIIDQGIKSFMEVAQAFVEIRDRALYREKHKTFEEYCSHKWSITARHANRLMLAGEVISNIKSDQLVSSEPAALPENEAQARPLEPLSKKEQVEAAKIVAKKEGKHTAKDFENAANQVTGKKPKAKKQEEQSEIEEDHETPRVQSYDPRKEAISGNLEKLVELIDQAQTQARKTADCEDVAKSLGDLAKLVTNRMNGGRK